MAAKFFLKLVQFPILVIIVTLLVTAAFVYKAKQGLFDADNSLIVDSSVEPFMGRGSGTFSFFKSMRDKFGNEEVLVIAIQPIKEGAFDFEFFQRWGQVLLLKIYGVPFRTFCTVDWRKPSTVRPCRRIITACTATSNRIAAP